MSQSWSLHEGSGCGVVAPMAWTPYGLELMDTSPHALTHTAMLPLAVDLDGTLLRVDTLHEGLITRLRQGPVQAWHTVVALRGGKAAFKRHIANGAATDPGLLPYDTKVLDYLRRHHAQGRRLGLFTAADQSIADGVAGYLGLFEVVRGSHGGCNLSGAAKAAAIEAAFGRPYAYAGDSLADAPVFRQARQVVLAGSMARAGAPLPEGVTVEARFVRERAGLRTWARALRLPHWAKNALVFVSPLLGANWAQSAGPAVLLFVLMGVLASATYLLNDALDLQADRRHPAKRLRPMAAGIVPVRDGLAVAAVLAVAALGAGALLLPRAASMCLVAYLVITVVYSTACKRVPMLDITVLAGLFTLRILAGNGIMAQPVSPWLLTFSMLFFLGLAATKRFAELDRVVREAEQAKPGTVRGYGAADLPVLLATGVASGISAIAVFMVYLVSDQYPRDVYANPGMLWGIMPVLLMWTLRMWHLCVHGRLREDPVVFATTDRVSWVLGAAALGMLVLARL